MDVSDLLVDAFDRLPEMIGEAVDGLTADQLCWQPAPGANPIGWLVWHLTRVQDHHLSELLDQDQLWVTGTWAHRFGLRPDPHDTGYGHTAAQVAAVRPDGPRVLADYYDAVAARTRDLLRTLTPTDLDRVVDERWDPPVTLGVRLVSVANDDVAHAAQAAYVRGLLP
ncbi:mycothiol transferase [Catellatospora tritici]|uniref:mycothiol transferase n=1 Tax=Catellatospora tritici TaxID=2851566 RepID=UPI001C2D1A9C|nr:DinB family protein [Catellatospora tritici]MBV1856203.1 DinB family protein [Catellatospora tritici]